MELAAKKLHKYKPVMLGLALSSMLPEVTDEQIADYDGILKVPGDDREAQIIHNFDALHGFVKEQIQLHNLDAPPLFQLGHIDRNCLLYYNKKQVTKFPQRYRKPNQTIGELNHCTSCKIKKCP